MAGQERDDEPAMSQFTRRSLLLGAAQLTGFSLVGWRLFDLQVLSRDRYAPLAEENRINLQILIPTRGRIMDRAGRPLADNEETFRATVTPALVKDLRGVLARLQRIVPLTDAAVADILQRAKKQSRSTPITVASDLTFEQIARINLFAPNLPGIGSEPTSRRTYHGGAAVGHVVGFVGSVERLGVDDDAVLRLPEMRVGKCGAEAGFESVLRGSGGTAKVEVDARGRIVRNLETLAPVPGRDVTLTVDADLQQALLARMNRERLAAAVVLDVASGEIVASASRPGFDPSHIVGGISEADWKTLSTATDHPLLDRTISAQYTPGPVFKPVTALAALDAGVVSPAERIRCPGHYDFAGRKYPCWNAAGHGDLTVRDALRQSCDVVFLELARRIGIRRLAAAARQLGLGAACGVRLANERAGVVPDHDWKRGHFNAPWSEKETLLTGVGIGYLQATPLQLARMTARLATGRAVDATIEAPDPRTPRTDFAALPFKASDLTIIRGGLIAAVGEDSGVAAAAGLGAGRPALAAQTDPATGAASWQKRTDAICTAYVPADAPRYAIATVVERGGPGGWAAATLSRDIVTAVLDHDEHKRAGLKPADSRAEINSSTRRRVG